MIRADAPEPVQGAAQDLAKDFARVFGTRARIVRHEADASATAVIIRVREDHRSPRESFVIAAQASNGRRAVLLEGADVRGTIYAVYEFSRKYLGVDPMYFWTDNEPAHRSSVAILEHLNDDYPAPVFQFEAFSSMTKICLPVGRPRRRRSRPESRSRTHPEILERAWRNAVNEYLPGQEVVWSVGLRGLSDVSYASMDPSVRGDNKALGRLIMKAIADQVQIVRANHPDAAACRVLA